MTDRTSTDRELHDHYASNAKATGHAGDCALVTADRNWPTIMGRPACTCGQLTAAATMADLNAALVDALDANPPRRHWLRRRPLMRWLHRTGHPVTHPRPQRARHSPGAARGRTTPKGTDR